MAYEIGINAIKHINNGEYEEAIKLLEEAQELDPIRLIYPFEVAYARYNLEEFDAAIEILDELKNRQDVTDHIYQLLGNSYFRSGNPEKAMEIYKKGLLRFRSSGHLYLEVGILEYMRENYQEAIMNWETGIRVQPDYASNYYWLGRTFAGSNKRIWGILYSELFMILEPKSKRSGEMSELLYKTYNASINFAKDSSVSKHLLVNASDKNMPSMSFDSDVAMITAISTVQVSGKPKNPLTIHQLVKIREQVLEKWLSMNLKDKYSNILFEFHEEMKEAGVFEAYNYWLLRRGDAKNFMKWHKKNEEKFKEFVNWFNEHSPSINKENYLVRE